MDRYCLQTICTRGAFLLVLLLSGCGVHYVTPAGGVSYDQIADEEIYQAFSRRPASEFPAHIAFVRIQQPGYMTETSWGVDRGSFSVVTTRDVETLEQLEGIAKLPLIDSLAPVGLMLLPPETYSVDSFRKGAAKLRADMLLIYSMDTRFFVDGKVIAPLSLLSLGLVADREAHVISTVYGMVVDVRTGFVYGTVEGTAREDQRSSIWTLKESIDDARVNAEADAFQHFVSEFGSFWETLVSERQIATNADALQRINRIPAGTRYYTLSRGDDNSTR